MTAPKRIQAQRTKGWRLPSGVVKVTRGTRWGNPFKGEEGAATFTREMLANDYFEWLTAPALVDPRDGRAKMPNGCDHHLGVPYADRPSLDEVRAALAGKDLACWCPLDQPCHADVLLKLANVGRQS